jgi:hypothetical protein
VSLLLRALDAVDDDRVGVAGVGRVDGGDGAGEAVGIGHAR